MRLSHFNTSALSIRNNSLKQNKQNKVSFKGQFQIGKNKEEADRVVDMFIGDVKHATMLRDFVLWCNNSTSSDTKGYIKAGWESDYQFGKNFYVSVYDNNDKNLAYSSVNDTDAEYYDWSVHCPKGDIIKVVFDKVKDQMKQKIQQAEENKKKSEQEREARDILATLLAKQ